MNKLRTFERQTMTKSSADYLAGLYDQGGNIDSFSESLPYSARVIDIGSGLSDFGHAVAVRRPDIEWTNCDINYNWRRGHPQYELVAEAIRKAPRNLRFSSRSILNLPSSWRGQFDRAYSYNLITHLLRIDKGLGHEALTGMVELLADEGELSVGPTNAKMSTNERWGVTTLQAGSNRDEIAAAESLLTTPNGLFPVPITEPRW